MMSCPKTARLELTGGWRGIRSGFRINVSQSLNFSGGVGTNSIGMRKSGGIIGS
jgi:hypothetical protein